jgi:hypothetical protein
MSGNSVLTNTLLTVFTCKPVHIQEYKSVEKTCKSLLKINCFFYLFHCRNHCKDTEIQDFSMLL